MTATLINLGFYRFSPLGDRVALEALRGRVRELCSALELRGTVLLAPEGVNAMVTGSRAAIDAFKNFARVEWSVEEKVFKEGPVDVHSFERMLVKLKKEIIPVGDPELRPDRETAQRVSAQELKRWLDEGREITLLDTRNRYEVEVGTFKNAETFELDHSREFAAKAAQNLGRLRSKPVVTFCTGGIRCEKASAYLLKLGLSDVYQLDGGILRYFEENGSAHFDGHCFVFDWRLAVDGQLQPVRRAEDPAQEFGRHIRKP